MTTKSSSQLQQDLNVIKYYQNKPGYFIELGAFDGINLSNTYLLEKEYQWTGICIEPLKSEYDKLIQNRNCICENKLIYSKEGIEFDFSPSDLFSGIINHMDCHKKHINKNIIKLLSQTLTNVLDQHKAPSFIEYLSLDTEGSELEILKGIHFDKYNFGLINIEHNYIEPRRSQIRSFLKDKNYLYIGENKWDDDYLFIPLIIGSYIINNDYNNIATIDYQDQKLKIFINNISYPITIKNYNINMGKLGSGTYSFESIQLPNLNLTKIKS